MAYIIHYTQIDGQKESIVITEDEDTPETRENNCPLGFKFYATYEIDGDLGTLPLDRNLYPG